MTMPVEIKELVVRAVVRPAASGGEDRPPSGGAGADAEREAILQACVREVLGILRKSKER